MSRRAEKSSQKCYFCGEPATSREHAPPLCIFPEGKDVHGQDYRKNLITVPSCDEHNSKKSLDDEYLFFVLLSTYKKNPLADRHFHTKLVRLNRKSSKLFESMNVDPLHLDVKDQSGKKITSGVTLKVDLNRYQSALTHVAFALYFYTFESTPTGKFEILLNGLNYFKPGKEKEDAGLNVLTEGFNVLFDRYEASGSNREVFSYTFTEKLQSKVFLRMRFHEHMDIVCSFAMDE